MKNARRKYLFYTAAIVLIFVVTIGLGAVLQNQYSQLRQEEAGRVLKLYSENMTQSLRDGVYYANDLSQMDPGDSQQQEWFELKAQWMLEQEGVLSVMLFEGDTVKAAYPESMQAQYIGTDMKDLSYLYTLAKVVKEEVVEGPVYSDTLDQNVFLYLFPILDGEEYKGEITVALDQEFVIGLLGLDELQDMGYDYLLWKVNNQDGSKDIIAVSDKDADFSYAAKEEFYFPGQWTLSIMPKGGWIAGNVKYLIIGISVFLSILFAILFLKIAGVISKNRYYNRLRFLDRDTGMLNREGMIRLIDRWIEAEKGRFAVFYFAVEDYSHAVLAAGKDQEKAYLLSVPNLMKEYIKSPYQAGRITEGGFAVAVREDMAEADKVDFAKGLSLKMIWKIRVAGEKLFLGAKYDYVSYPDDGDSGESLLNRLTNNYYTKLTKESPINDMTEKCRQLAEGRTDVKFSKYADVQMMELSMALSRYKKRVEQVAYYDPAYNIGNRMKYLRDVQILISYDDRRRFRLYGVDIRSFSKYNELFNVMTGDALLMEMTRRLTDIFGSSLYRINGDVFVGISFGSTQVHLEDPIIKQIQEVFERPVIVNDAVFTLDALIGICEYPKNAVTPEKLLECTQSAISYAKSGKGGVGDGIVRYNGEILEISRKERMILDLLRNSLLEGTLEVWYQPVYDLKKEKFTGVEALVRLADGKGRYVPADQVIEIAERNGLVTQVGEYVMNRAGTFMHKKGIKLGLETMGINLSVQQLFVENSTEQIFNQISSTGVNPKYITLEITETVLIQSIEKAEKILSGLSELGMGIALDDFGVGYSSLNYLLNLPVDSLKFDRAMTTKSIKSEKQYSLLKAILDVAHYNHIDTVVEGVETEEELALIKDTSAVYIQGFYYSKALREEELEKFITRNN